MKKFTSILMTALMTLMSLSLTSCDEDADIADTLYGSWKGYMDIGLVWDNQYYESTVSEITFDTDGYYTDHGTGYWIDRYSRAPWDYVANHIEWYVRNGVISVHFMEEDTYATIRDYHLDDDYFYGTMVSGNSSADFKMVKTYRPNSWSNYYWYGSDSWYDSWYYGSGWARKQSATSTRTDESKVMEKDSSDMNKKESLKNIPEMIRVVNYQEK